MYRTVLVGTDGSETAARAVATAADLAKASGARLVVVTAYSHDEQKETEAVSQRGVPDELRFTLTDRVQAEDLAKRGRALAREAGVTNVVVATDEGPAPEVLLDLAEDHAADLVVVGSKGMTGAGRFLGSVANTVTHHAPCDVLVVHTT